MQRFCLTLDLVDDPEMIKKYEEHHAPGNDWPEVTQHDLEAGITHMEIYRYGTRMFMIMETTDDFTLEKKAGLDAANPKIQEWEKLMWGFQVPVPGAKPGQKWVLMDKIFQK